MHFCLSEIQNLGASQVDLLPSHKRSNATTRRTRGISHVCETAYTRKCKVNFRDIRNWKMQLRKSLKLTWDTWYLDPINRSKFLEVKQAYKQAHFETSYLHVLVMNSTSWHVWNLGEIFYFRKAHLQVESNNLGFASSISHRLSACMLQGQRASQLASETNGTLHSTTWTPLPRRT